jgi:outer membrane protein OmpA-like peptidoglycan-associated protein
MRQAIWLLVIVLLSVLPGCASNPDKSVIATSLSEAAASVVLAREAQAEDLSYAQLMKSENLLEEANKALKDGDAKRALHLAAQADIEAKIAEAQAKAITAKERVSSARSKKIETILAAKSEEVAAAKVRQNLYEKMASKAQTEAQAAIKEAEEAKAETKKAKENAKRAVEAAKVELAISKAELMLNAAAEVDAPINSATLYNQARSLTDEAKAALAAGDLDKATRSAEKALDDASHARVIAATKLESLRSQTQIAKQRAITAITRAQTFLDQAEEAKASEYAADTYKIAAAMIEQANTSLKSEDFDQVLRLAAQAESHAQNARSAAIARRNQLEAQAKKEEAMAAANDAIFKAQQILERAIQAQVEEMIPETYQRAKNTLDEANKTLKSEDFTKAIALANESASYATEALAKAENIAKTENEIISVVAQIPEISARTGRNGLTLSLSGDIFPLGATQINPKVYPRLDAIAAILKKYPSYKVVIEGHTDSSGNPETNLKLSIERAANFLRYLVDKGHVSPDQVSSAGYGNTRPIASNADEAGRKQNRRIDMVILTR